jgi:2',3'-cyclic-nucleotide 2'-phosphodiesterase (5'-nucleotidase family)
MNFTPKPGTLRLIQGQPNPHGAPDTELYLFVGDATSGPITEIIPDKGIVLPECSDTLSSSTFRLHVLHINDLHGHISRFKATGDRPIFSKIVYRIKGMRQRFHDLPHSALLVLSAGDDVGGTVLDELLGDDPDSYMVHAGYRLYSTAGVDVGLVGNHDLDNGSQLLAHAIQQDANFPILSANIHGSQWLENYLYPAVLLVIKGVRIGIIGLTTPATIRPQQDSGMQVSNPIQVANNLWPAIRPQCDILIILSHLGYSLSSVTASVMEAGDVELARSLPYGGVHLIVGGHTHDELNHHSLTADNIVNGIPIVQAGALGECVGEVDITVHGPNAAVTSVRLNPTIDLPIDKSFEEEEVQPVVELAKPFFKRVLGQVADHSDLSALAVRNDFAAGETALANFITDALVLRCRANGYNADLACIDTSCVRSGLPYGGHLNYRDWFQIMPFADTIRLCWLTGDQLCALIEDNALRIDRLDEPHTERGFLQFSRQVRYVVELGRRRLEGRATNIVIDGISVEEQLDRSFLVGCTNYVRMKARPWEAFAASFYNLDLMEIFQNPPLETPLFLRDELVTYIQDNGGVTEAGGAKRDGRLVIT